MDEGVLFLIVEQDPLDKEKAPLARRG